MYEHQDEKIMFRHTNGDMDHFANCKDAANAIKALNRALTLNYNRKYTASARMYAKAASYPGFEWIKPAD